jgi:dolichol-phosphate mannosyltransferase
MVPWLGFRSAPLQYNREKRHGGSTKYPLGKMIKFALDSIFSFSNAPLRLANYVGGLIVFLGVVAGFTVPGISSVLIAVMFIGGIQIMMIGLIGEYIGRIFEEAKNRPVYVVRETRNIEDSAHQGGAGQD